MLRGIEYTGTWVDESCNQASLEDMVLPLLCKWFKQRDERHLIELWCRLKEIGYGDLALRSRTVGEANLDVSVV